MGEHKLRRDCSTCRYARELTEPGRQGIECWRYPPQPQAMMGQNNITGKPQIVGTIGIFPPVLPTTWCGEHAPKPESMQ
jgi:hypothetical protein